MWSRGVCGRSTDLVDGWWKCRWLVCVGMVMWKLMWSNMVSGCGIVRAPWKIDRRWLAMDIGSSMVLEGCVGVSTQAW